MQRRPPELTLRRRASQWLVTDLIAGNLFNTLPKLPAEPLPERSAGWHCARWHSLGADLLGRALQSRAVLGVVLDRVRKLDHRTFRRRTILAAVVERR